MGGRYLTPTTSRCCCCSRPRLGLVTSRGYSLTPSRHATNTDTTFPPTPQNTAAPLGLPGSRHATVTLVPQQRQLYPRKAGGKVCRLTTPPQPQDSTNTVYPQERTGAPTHLKLSFQGAVSRQVLASPAAGLRVCGSLAHLARP